MSTDALDDAVVARAVAGDGDALETALRATEPALRAGISIRPVFRRDIEAADIVQVSCLEAFLRIRSLRERPQPGSSRGCAVSSTTTCATPFVHSNERSGQTHVTASPAAARGNRRALCSRG